MKRRNADCGKIRRPVKRTKISEGIYGSTFLYVKFLVVWALVLLADFVLEFRFEYLWPLWLLLRSVYDSFKYQGLAFSVFFVFIAFTSDMICFLFIPVHWLFFAASTYVWVQYVWHTERGICLPTISLWLLFVYIEASVRLKELKNLPFHLDLCRPFAAHCIGYPVVTLGFGFKSYVGYRMRLRKQKEVAKENEFYIHLLQQALPAEAPSIANVCSQDKDKSPKTPLEDGISNGHCVTANHGHGRKSICNSSGGSHNIIINNNTTPNGDAVPTKSYAELEAAATRKQHHHHHHSSSSSTANNNNSDYAYVETPPLAKQTVNDFDESDGSCEREKTTYKSNGIAMIAAASSASSSSSSGGGGGKGGKWNHNSLKDNVVGGGASAASKRSRNSSKENNFAAVQKDDHTYRLEADIKRLKADLQSSRQCEQDLRSQIGNISSGERSVRGELNQVQQDNDTLQHKLHNLVTARQQDKQTISSLEKRLTEERRLRTAAEAQLTTERKAKKAEEAAAARAVAMATARTECTENCKSRRRDLENDMKQLRRDIKIREDKIQQMERQAQSMCSGFAENMGSTQALVSALSAMEEKNARLENSLSAETRLKLDLFSALGEAKRQLEIAQGMLSQRDKEIDDLKSKIAEVMAVMPVTSSPQPPVGCYSPSQQMSLLYSPKYLGQVLGPADDSNKLMQHHKSNLDPNACAYTPKLARMNSSDACKDM